MERVEISNENINSILKLNGALNGDLKEIIEKSSTSLQSRRGASYYRNLNFTQAFEMKWTSDR